MTRVSLPLCALAGLTASCTIPDQVEIFNNTRAGVVISACGRSERVGDGLLFKARSRCLLPFEISSSYGTWTYRRINENEALDGLGRETSGGHLVRLQLESNGVLIAVPANVAYSASSLSLPPWRIPLQPE